MNLQVTDHTDKKFDTELLNSIKQLQLIFV